MNRQEFGQLLAALRQDLDWTQFQLSEYAGVDEAIISQIERGVKKFFEPDLLFKLANALQLTTLERREFFLAASGLDQRQMVRQVSSATATDTSHPSKILSRLIETLSSVQCPAFINDVYGDAIAVNQAVVDFFHVPASMIDTAGRKPGGYNIMRMTFDHELVGRTHVYENWDEYAMTTITSYRATTLRYRAKPYFKYLLKTFRDPLEYPLFDRYWKRAASMEADRATETDFFHYRHEIYGQIRYLTAPIITITAFGELFLTVYQPLDDHTTEIFAQINKEASKEIIMLAPWPEKRMP